MRNVYAHTSRSQFRSSRIAMLSYMYKAMKFVTWAKFANSFSDYTSLKLFVEEIAYFLLKKILPRKWKEI